MGTNLYNASSSSSGKYNFKVTIGDETRRFSMAKDLTYWRTLCDYIKATFSSLPAINDGFVLYYYDSDQDVISISSDLELAELLGHAEVLTNVIRLYNDRQESQENNVSTAWVFAEDSAASISNSSSQGNPRKRQDADENTTSARIEQQQHQQDPPVRETPSSFATEPRPQGFYANTFERLGGMLDRFKEKIEQDPEVMRIMSQMASTIITTVATNTRINLEPIEEWLQSLNHEQRLYPGASAVPSPMLGDLYLHSPEINREPPQYNVNKSPEQNMFYDSEERHHPQQVAAATTTRGKTGIYMPPPPPPPPLLASFGPVPRQQQQWAACMEPSLYPPPPSGISPLGTRVSQQVGTSLGWSESAYHPAYNPHYYSVPLHYGHPSGMASMGQHHRRRHHPVPPPPPLGMYSSILHMPPMRWDGHPPSHTRPGEGWEHRGQPFIYHSDPWHQQRQHQQLLRQDNCHHRQYDVGDGAADSDPVQGELERAVHRRLRHERRARMHEEFNALKTERCRLGKEIHRLLKESHQTLKKDGYESSASSSSSTSSSSYSSFMSKDLDIERDRLDDMHRCLVQLHLSNRNGRDIKQ